MAGWGIPMGEEIGEGGAREVIGGSSVWRNLSESYRFHEHKRTHERTETVSLVPGEGEGKLGRAPELREWDRRSWGQLGELMQLRFLEGFWGWSEGLGCTG